MNKIKNESLTKEISKKVKQNRKYRTISDDIIQQEISDYLKSNPKTTQITKQDIKEIRAKLHRLYSTYQTRNKKKINKYLEELKQNPTNPDTTKQLLSLTLSTKERLPHYKSIYKKIFKITKKPKTIIDLGAGFNPLSTPLMNLKDLTYLAYDINTEDIKSLNKYFKIMKKKFPNFKGEASTLDTRNINKLKQLPKSDLILMFKLIDLLTTKQAEQIILTLQQKTRHIITSFATKTITRKQMTKPKREWFEMMLERNNLKYKTITTENEMFYIINR